MILEITEDGTHIYRDHETFVIKTLEKKRIIPAKKIESINITSNATISTAAIKLCLQNQINLVISDKSGKPEGRFWFSTLGKNSEIRREQYLNYDTELGLIISNKIVKLKVAKQYSLAYEIWKNRKESREEISIYLNRIKEIYNKLKHKIFNKGSLLGMEGAAANAYFSILRFAIPEKFEFRSRSQIAKDPINASLNYLYGMCYREIEATIITTGLDPNSGFYHASQYGKPVLSFDLIEIFRADIDRLLLYLISKKRIKSKLFIKEESGLVILSKEARKIMIEEYYTKLAKHIKYETFKLCFWIISELYGQR
jgi:CRISPR-associated protein Cas1